MFYLQDDSSPHHKQERKIQSSYYPQPNIVHSPRSKKKAKKCPRPLDPDKLQKIVDSALKYQFYIDGSVHDKFITPLREAWLTKATRYVGRYSRHMVSSEVYHDTMIIVAGEINKVYKQSMRQAILDYVLKVNKYNDLLIYCYVLKFS